MFKTTNKIESARIIKQYKLNVFKEKIFKSHNAKEILKFADENPVKYYCVRSKSKSNAKTHIFVTREMLVDYCKTMGEVFSINPSSTNYQDNQTLSGEIMITSDYKISYSVSNKITSAEQFRYFPQYYGNTDIFDKKLNRIPGIDEIVSYILKHKLFNMVVEFSCFDISVGTNHEKTVIYEVRTHY